MTRISRKEKIKAVSPKKRHYKPAVKTGPKKDALKEGYKVHMNALEGMGAFFPKMK